MCLHVQAQQRELDGEMDGVMDCNFRQQLIDWVQIILETIQYDVDKKWKECGPGRLWMTSQERWWFAVTTVILALASCLDIDAFLLGGDNDDLI